MTIDLTQFHESFFEESFEAITSMEDALLQLNVGTPDPATVNTISRNCEVQPGASAVRAMKRAWWWMVSNSAVSKPSPT